MSKNIARPNNVCQDSLPPPSFPLQDGGGATGGATVTFDTDVTELFFWIGFG